MRRFVFLMISVFLLTFIGSPSVRALWLTQTVLTPNQVENKPIPEVPIFRLADPTGKVWLLSDFTAGAKATVVLFLGTQCPINNAYAPRLAELHRTYAEKGVRFVAINSNSGDTPAKIAAHAKEHKLPFPVLKDPANVVADQFGARRTPEAFVLSADRKMIYQGRIDDQFGINFKRPEPTQRDLVRALDEVLAGKAVSQSKTDAPGCLIARVIKPKEKGSVTYSQHVSRILQKNCQECHRPGQVGPMSLLTYEDAVGWSAMIEEVVRENRMPPWHADPKHGKFLNDRSLSSVERKQLLDWIEQGCPKGEEKDLPESRTFVEGWRIGKPDVVFEMPRAFKVPAKAGPRGIAYQYYVVPTNFEEDRWIERAEAKPGAHAVVHHIIVYVAQKGTGFFSTPRPLGDPRDGIGNGLLVAYAPGDMPLMLKQNQAKKLPKGAMLLFQMHYTPNGIQQEDKSSVGLIFSKKAPETEVQTRGVAYGKFLIPAGEPNHEVKSQTRFDKDVDILSLLPHMHVRGKDFKYEAVYPDGKRETLLSVPRYDFNWQSNYILERPLRLPAGSRIECTAHFDNSVNNPNNPDPKVAVRWGDQTWQEMMIGFVDYAPVKK